jgi:hypothetical protein
MIADYLKRFYAVTIATSSVHRILGKPRCQMFEHAPRVRLFGLCVYVFRVGTRLAHAIPDTSAISPTSTGTASGTVPTTATVTETAHAAP